MPPPSSRKPRRDEEEEGRKGDPDRVRILARLKKATQYDSESSSSEAGSELDLSSDSDSESDSESESEWDSDLSPDAKPTRFASSSRQGMVRRAAPLAPDGEGPGEQSGSDAAAD